MFGGVASLDAAYRPSNLFVAKMVAQGHSLQFLTCDEQLTTAVLHSPVLQQARLLYFATHGIFDNATGYRFVLHQSDWALSTSGFPGQNLVVGVFDTCHLIDPSANWRNLWSGIALPPSLRIILGWDGPAPMDVGTTIRGGAFAEELLQGRPFADAWRLAVERTLPPQAKYWKQNRGIGSPIAIGLGDTQHDADSVLQQASLHFMPPPRLGYGVYFSLV
jgi:hypothetical protein